MFDKDTQEYVNWLFSSGGATMEDLSAFSKELSEWLDQPDETTRASEPYCLRPPKNG